MNEEKKKPTHPDWAVAHRKPGTELKKIKGAYYLYGVKGVYDPVAKRSRKVSLGIIGRITEADGLIPSSKAVLKERLKSAPPPVVKVLDKEYGFSRFLFGQMENAVLPGLKEHFPEDWAMVAAMAYCRMLHRSPLKNCPFFLSCASLPEMLGMAVPEEKELSLMLRRIGRERGSMVRYMKRSIEDGDCVLVDATDIACNSTHIPLSQKGYNGKMDFEPQVTLLYIYSAKNHKPLYFRLVAGNIRDVTILKNALVESGTGNAVFISDKGFFSAGNLEKLDQLDMDYIIPLRRGNRAIEYGLLKDVETGLQHFKFRERYVFYASHPYQGKRISIFLDGRLREDEKTDYLNRIVSHPEDFTVEKYAQRLPSMGTLALIHNDREKPEEAYLLYKGRGEIEQFFDCYKNTIDAHASHMQNEDALHGWMFINHVAMQMTYGLFEKLKNNKLVKHHSIKDVIQHLAQIRRVQVNDSEHFISEINKKTKNILAKLKIPIT